MGVIFITGIDTGIGKTYATGLLARFLLKQGISTITQKIVQTGCEEISEDIGVHRRIMGIGYTEEDKNGLTCPYVLRLPASPHLAAGAQGVRIDPEAISAATDRLSRAYFHVLVEGAGGIYVPLNDDATLIDYLAERRYPVIIVSSPRLGSINHTLLTLEAIERRNLHVRGIIYNLYPDEKTEITEDSKKVFMKFLSEFGFSKTIVEIPEIDLNNIPDIDFSDLIL
jgi:dethiobiotin synthetase